MTEEERYSLVEIADLLGTPSTTIRYRARLFQEFLHPIRRPRQFRGVRYPTSDLGVFQLVDRLYKEERSTGDIRRALEEARDGKVIDATVSDEDGAAPPALRSNGPEAVARILRDGIAQAMAPIHESNRQIADSLGSLHELLSERPDDDGGLRNEIRRLLDRVAELEQSRSEPVEVPHLRERIRQLEAENQRLRQDLDEARRSLARRLLDRALGAF